MLIKKRKLTNKIYLLQFDSQKSMAKTFLRFSEHYESPEFMGRIFTHREFKEWYTKSKGKFSYYTDWDGFNLPSESLKPFRQGKFNPLTQDEKKFISLFKNVKGNFYIISFHGGGHHLFGHELAHALFYTNPNYKKKILKILKKYNTDKIKKELLSWGYAKNVLDDEVQAYSVSLSHELEAEISKKLIRDINKIFSKYCPKFL